MVVSSHWHAQVGTGVALLTVSGATIPDFWLAFALIVVSGFATGLFGGVQSAMVMSMVPDELRGRALGLLTMFIGGAPIGCVVLGELAERLGISPALRGFTGCGFVLLLLWLAPCGWPQVLGIQRPK
jgi:predicted MFS family arabinose efflux permease